MHSTAMGGANFVLHSAGWMEGGLVTGFEKLVIDADRLGAYQKLLGGIDTDDNALGTNAYEDVEPAGHFLGSAHTMRNYETAYYDAVLSDSESFEQWTERGGKDTAQRAFERWNRCSTNIRHRRSTMRSTGRSPTMSKRKNGTCPTPGTERRGKRNQKMQSHAKVVIIGGGVSAARSCFTLPSSAGATSCSWNATN